MTTEMAEGGWIKVERILAYNDSWWETHVWGCDNGHVSTRVLKSEALGRDACLVCRAPLFPVERVPLDGSYPGYLWHE